jgi:hypothetical protein
MTGGLIAVKKKNVFGIIAAMKKGRFVLMRGNRFVRAI